MFQVFGQRADEAGTLNLELIFDSEERWRTLR